MTRVDCPGPERGGRGDAASARRPGDARGDDQLGHNLHSARVGSEQHQRAGHVQGLYAYVYMYMYRYIYRYISFMDIYVDVYLLWTVPPPSRYSYKYTYTYTYLYI